MRGMKTLLRRPVAWAVASILLLAASSLLIVGCQQSGGPGGGNGDTFQPGDAEEYAPGRSGEIVTVELPAPDGESVTITFEEIDGLAVYQGDMILGEADFFRDADSITELETEAMRCTGACAGTSSASSRSPATTTAGRARPFPTRSAMTGTIPPPRPTRIT